MNEPRNFYGEAIGALEDLEARDQTNANRIAAQAVVLSNLAVCDAVYSLRDHVEELKGRIGRLQQ